MNYKITENLELKPTRNKYKYLTFFLILILIANVYALLCKTDSVKIIYRYVYPEKESTDIKLTEEELTKCLHENGCVLPNIAVAQARLESGLGKSVVGRNAKNMFGITYHKCKYVSGKYGVYATYKTYRDNIKCYIHIQDYYLRAIDGRYAEAPDYIQTIKKMK
jgi:hypothetical protein